MRFVKGAYHRPFTAPDGTVVDDAGRVTELTAKPLFGIFYPELCGFGQPLAGEVAARRDLLRSIPFCTGYAVETAMMIDVLRHAGLGAMAQVDLGTRLNRSQRLLALGAMSYAVARAVMMRVEGRGERRPTPRPTCTRPARPPACSSSSAACRCSSARRWRNCSPARQAGCVP